MTHSSPAICTLLGPPPLPPSTDSSYIPLINFVKSDETFRRNFLDYTVACGGYFDIDAVPDIKTSTTKAIISTPSPYFDESKERAITSTPYFNESKEITSTPYFNESKEITPTPYFNESKETGPTKSPYLPIGHQSSKGETANAGLIVGLIVAISFFLIILFCGLWWYWKKYIRKEQSSQALPIDNYKTVNYLHNKADKKEHWKSSSAQDAIVENEHTEKHKENGVRNSVTDNGTVKTGGTKGNELSKLDTSQIKTHGYVNNMFEQNGEESPGIRSTKSDTPLFDRVDGTIVQTLPNETVQADNGKKVMTGDTDKVSFYGSTKNVPQQRGNALQPIESPSKASLRKKKKKKSSQNTRKSAPCPNSQDLAEDLAENRKSV